MKIKNLFKLYEQAVTSKPNIETIFTNSGIANEYKKLDFGFFPLGSGILTTEGEIENAEIEICNILVLGNDFGTQKYLADDCPDNKEKLSNPTIRNLIAAGGLELDLATTFFTNLHLGLRKEGTNIKRITQLDADYKDVCFEFFKIQLDFLNPKVVLCLGKEVVRSLIEFSNVFSEFSLGSKTVLTNDSFFGARKFVQVPHPSMAHFNWTAVIKSEVRGLLEI